MPGKVKQRDITDCGAACLASVALHYGMKLPVARIRQLACTDKMGTNVLGMVDAAKRMGFTAKGVKGSFKSLNKIPLPAIAHVSLENGLQHFMVISAVKKNTVVCMDPADGQMHRRSHDAFREIWTGVLVLMVPSDAFTRKDELVSNRIRFWTLLAPHRSIIIQALTGAILFAVLGLASAVYLGKLVDYVLPTGNINLLNLLGVTMILIILFRLVLNTFQMKFVLRTGQKIDATLILGYYKHIMRLPQSFFDNMRAGEIISRVNDALKVRVFINDIAINLVVNVLILLVSFTLMFTYYWKLATIMLLLLPLYGIVYTISDRLNKSVQRKIMERSADLESQIVESLHAINTIKRNNLEDFMNTKTEVRFTGLLSQVYKSGLNSIFSGNASSFITQGFTLILLWVGAGYALKNQISPGELLSFYALLGYFTNPVNSIIGFNRSLQDALIASDRLFEIFDLEPLQSDGQVNLEPNHISKIRFDNVGFRYGTRVQVFESFDLEIFPNQLMAIVGESGCGKSTLASLLQNIYPIQQGKIYIGEYPIEMFKRESIRSQIAVVPQKTDIFSGNVIENIAVGEYAPDMKAILEVCNQLALSSFIEQLPEGLHTHLGESGVKLSGGQKQRIAIARAIYQDPSVLILDEATSSLDMLAEQYVHKTIKKLHSQGKTIIIIAHRLSTVRLADRIVVIDQGRVVQDGCFEKLINAKGKLREMFAA